MRVRHNRPRYLTNEKIPETDIFKKDRQYSNNLLFTIILCLFIISTILNGYFYLENRNLLKKTNKEIQDIKSNLNNSLKLNKIYSQSLEYGVRKDEAENIAKLYFNNTFDTTYNVKILHSNLVYFNSSALDNVYNTTKVDTLAWRIDISGEGLSDETSSHVEKAMTIYVLVDSGTVLKGLTIGYEIIEIE